MKTHFLISKILTQKLSLFLGILFISFLVFLEKAEATCTISNTTPGNLSIQEPKGYSLSSANSPGSFMVSCSGSVLVIIIDSINDLSGGKNAVDQASAIISDTRGNEIVSANTFTLSKLPPQTSGSLSFPSEASETYSVNLTLSNNATMIRAGNYSYSVGITLTVP